ncbi:MAG: phenylalanine--tRNA ligase subunit beta [bacterium JZ-2024 1]
MKATLNWLKELCPSVGTLEEAVRLFTAVGLEVAGVQDFGEDTVLDLEVPSNRSDLLGVVGLARELCTAKGTPLVLPPVKDLDISHDSAGVTVCIEQPEACPRYTALCATLGIGAQTPQWMKSRLEALGFRAIHPIVDLTNYVMLEIGQPMHAFDASAIRDRRIVVRRAREGDSFVTLDERTLTLTSEDLLIADSDRGIALAGVIGGLDSGIHPFTREIIFESAWFHRAWIRATSRRHHTRTESSIRFEREVDPEGVVWAQARVAYLLESEGIGVAGRALLDNYPRPDRVRQVRYDPARYTRVIGQAVPSDKQLEVLSLLGFTEVAGDNGVSILQVPSHRRDVSEEEDLMEEVARHIGYDQIPESISAMPPSVGSLETGLNTEFMMESLLSGWGFQECVTLPLRSAGANEVDPLTGKPGVPVVNALSEDLSVLRPSLVPGLVDVLSLNARRRVALQPIFETGAVFAGDGDAVREERRFAMILPDVYEAPDWEQNAKTRKGSFFQMKGYINTLFLRLQVPSRWQARPASAPFLRPDRFLVLENAGGSGIGWLGEVAPDFLRERELSVRLFACEICLDAITGDPPVPVYEPWSPFPALARDLSMFVPPGISFSQIEQIIRDVAGPDLTGVALFDRYVDQKAGGKHTSIALELTFQSRERTLKGEEVDSAVQRVIRELEKTGIRVRK